MAEHWVLAGDIGGTSTRLGLFSTERGLNDPLRTLKYESDSAGSLMELVERFIEENEIPREQIRAASFAIAGPIINNRVEVTNLPWTISGGQLSNMLGNVPVELINDLVGLSNFIPAMGPDDLVILNDQEPRLGAAKAVIAPGTGLGESFLIWDGTAYRPQPSEGGHASFSPVNSQQIDLMNFLLKERDHVSVERVASGIGVPHLFDFLLKTGNYQVPVDFIATIQAAEDATRLIFEAGQGQDPMRVCHDTIQLFVEILATEASNLALKTLAFGGVYIGGGIPPRILDLIRKYFMPAYHHKGRFTEVVTQFPVYVIIHPDPNLLGAARWAFSLSGS
jgi:glucokinase